MTGHIRRRGGNSFELKFDIDPDPATGKRRVRYHSFRGTKKEANAKLVDLLASVGRGTEDRAMATLNIKNFPDDLYEQLQERAEREHRSLAQQVIHLLEESAGKQKLHSILELRGLGKELWKEIDPVEHVRAERDSWDS